MKKLLLICITSPLLLALNACSAGTAASTASGINQPVLAQTTYSTASLNGTYSVQLICTYCQNVAGAVGMKAGYGGQDAGTGTIQLDGAGGITAGTLNIYVSASPTFSTPCVENVTGTYSIQSTALGTASLNLTSSTTGCAPTLTWKLALATADGGSVIQFAESDGYIGSGSAIKQ